MSRVRVHYQRPSAEGESDGVAAIDIPTHVGAIRVAAVCGSFFSGLRAAVSIADQIANNPILKSVLPPGTATALDVVNQVANRRNPQAAARKVGGPGGARLQQALAAQKRPGSPMMPGGWYGIPGWR